MTPLDSFIYSALITSITTALLGFFVYWMRRSSNVNRTFSAYSLAIAFWSFCVYRHGAAQTPTESEFWGHALHIGSISIPLLFYRFVLIYLDHKNDSKRKAIFYSCILVWVFFQAINYTKWFVPGVRLAPPLRYLVIAGPLYHYFLVYFVALISYSAFLIFKAFLQAKGAKRTQLRFFLISTILGYAGGLDNFLIMYDIKIFPLFPYGTYTIAAYVAVATFIIFRYRFLEIEVIIKNTLVFAGLFTAVLFPILIAGYILSVLVMGVPLQLLLKWWWLFGLGAASIAITSRKIERFLIDFTDQHLFQKKSDYRKALRYASEGLANINSLNHQLRLVVHFLTLRARIKAAAIYMPGNGDHDYVLKSARPKEANNYMEKIPYDSPILLYLKTERKHPFLEFHSVERAITKFSKTAMYSYDLPKILDGMKRLHAELIVPSFFQGQLQGILVLSGKKSDEIYNDEDIQIFQTIAQESAIAFENARKHDELVTQSEKLSQANEEIKRTQAEVIQAKEEAAVSQLSGGIAHEVKNSIYGLYTGTEMVEDALRRIVSTIKNWHLAGGHTKDLNKTELFGDVEESIMGLKQVRQASQHIDDVAHTLSQLTKGKHAEMGRIGVRTLLKAMVSFGMLRTYGDRARTQALEEPPQINADSLLPPVRGHVELLRAVFLNLFKNAIYAMDGISPKRITINAKVDPAEKDMMRIEFSDNGKGIPPEVLPQIFDYGFTTKGAEGEGKGLFNVKTIIEGEHRGKISCESVVGKGTTFIIKLPIWKEESE